MAKKTDTLTVATPVAEKAAGEPRVRVILPLSEESASGAKVDPYEHVTINGKTTLIRRGEYVDVTIPVYMQLRNKFPRI